MRILTAVICLLVMNQTVHAAESISDALKGIIAAYQQKAATCYEIGELVGKTRAQIDQVKVLPRTQKVAVALEQLNVYMAQIEKSADACKLKK